MLIVCNYVPLAPRIMYYLIPYGENTTYVYVPTITCQL